MATSSRQREILDRTLELVGEYGLGGLTIRKIAERVGFTEAAVYRHFPNKTALLAALVGRLEDMLLGPLREIAADRQRSARDRLAAALAHHERVVFETDSLPILLLAEVTARRDEELVGRMRGLLAGYLEILEGLVHEAREERGETGSLAPGETAVLLLGLPAALAIRHRLLPGRDPARDTLARLNQAAVAAAVGPCPPTTEERR